MYVQIILYRPIPTTHTHTLPSPPHTHTHTQEEKFALLTGETPDSLYEGKLVTCTVVSIARRKPLKEVLERASPIQDKHTHLWQCPICMAPNFRDIGLVWQHFDDGSCPGQSFAVRTRLENGLSGFLLAKNISDKNVSSPEERVHVSAIATCIYYYLIIRSTIEPPLSGTSIIWLDNFH